MYIRVFVATQSAPRYVIVPFGTGTCPTCMSWYTANVKLNWRVWVPSSLESYARGALLLYRPARFLVRLACLKMFPKLPSFIHRFSGMARKGKQEEFSKLVPEAHLVQAERQEEEEWPTSCQIDSEATICNQTYVSLHLFAYIYMAKNLVVQTTDLTRSSPICFELSDPWRKHFEYWKGFDRSDSKRKRPCWRCHQPPLSSKKSNNSNSDSDSDSYQLRSKSRFKLIGS